MYIEGAYLEVLEGLLKGEVQRGCSPCGPWGLPGGWCRMRVVTLWHWGPPEGWSTKRVLTLWSLRASWRVMYNEVGYLVVLEGLTEGDVQWGCLPWGPWGPPGVQWGCLSWGPWGPPEGWSTKRVLTLWSLSASWRVMMWLLGPLGSYMYSVRSTSGKSRFRSVPFAFARPFSQSLLPGVPWKSNRTQIV